MRKHNIKTEKRLILYWTVIWPLKIFAHPYKKLKRRHCMTLACLRFNDFNGANWVILLSFYEYTHFSIHFDFFVFNNNFEKIIFLHCFLSTRFSTFFSFLTWQPIFIALHYKKNILKCFYGLFLFTAWIIKCWYQIKYWSSNIKIFKKIILFYNILS